MSDPHQEPTSRRSAAREEHYARALRELRSSDQPEHWRVRVLRLVAERPVDVPLDGAFDVVRERVRQIISEGYRPEHDDPDALAWKAYAILSRAADPERLDDPTPPTMWPGNGWKPPRTRRRGLVIAAALIVAAVDALDDQEES